MVSSARNLVIESRGRKLGASEANLSILAILARAASPWESAACAATEVSARANRMARGVIAPLTIPLSGRPRRSQASGRRTKTAGEPDAHPPQWSHGQHD